MGRPNGFGARTYAAGDRRAAFTLVEMLIAVVILGILAALAVPNLSAAREKAQIARAIGDLRALQFGVTGYYLKHGTYPATLDEAGLGGIVDPWDRPYRYTVIAGSGDRGAARKDRFLVPINSDFDLYSLGADGLSAGPLTAAESKDDIIRANDGGFVGLAADY